MNLLFVEDDDDKADRISQEIATAFPGTTLLRAKSFGSGLRKIVQEGPSLDGVLLDMSMPNFDNSDQPPETFAGRDLLRQCKLRGISKPTVVVTMLDLFGTPPDQLTLSELNEQLTNEFFPQYLGIVYYSSAHEGWKAELAYMIQKMKEGK